MFPSHRIFRRLAGGIGLFTFLLLLLFMLLMLLSTGAGSGQMDAMMALFFGWLRFLKRTLPHISWNGDLAFMGILCSAMILFLAHILLNWVARSVGSVRGHALKCPLKWSVCGLMALALCFLVGISVGGAAHQIGWITSSKDPWYERRPSSLQELIEMKQINMEFWTALLDVNTVDGLRRAMRNSLAENHHRPNQQKPFMQSYHMLYIVEPDGKVTGMLVFPRDQGRQAKVGGYYAIQNDDRQITAKDLPQTIRNLQGKLISF